MHAGKGRCAGADLNWQSRMVLRRQLQMQRRPVSNSAASLAHEQREWYLHVMHQLSSLADLLTYEVCLVHDLNAVAAFKGERLSTPTHRAR